MRYYFIFFIITITSSNVSSQTILPSFSAVHHKKTVDWSPSLSISPDSWLDASDGSNYNVNGSQEVTSITDKSGSTTFTIDGSPVVVSGNLNSLNTFEFDGNESLISANNVSWSSNGNHWAIGVFQWITVTGSKDSFFSADGTRTYAVSSAAVGSWPGEIDYDGSNSISSGSAKNDFTTSISANTWVIVSIVFNKSGNQIFGRLNGTTRTDIDPYSNSMDAVTDLRLMRQRSNKKLNGRMAEFFHVADIPGTGGTDISDVEKAEGYLAHKWGLEGNLPLSHPYKSSAPKN